MRFYELIRSVDRDAVFDQLVQLYDDAGRSLAGYRKAWDTLLELEPIPQHDGMQLQLTWVPPNPPFNRMGVYDVSGVYDVEHDGQRAGTKFSVSLSGWDEWLASEVSVVGVDVTPEQLVAHLLWELTWYGYDPDQATQLRAELLESKDELDEALASIPADATPEEREERLAELGIRSIKSLLKDLEDDD